MALHVGEDGPQVASAGTNRSRRRSFPISRILIWLGIVLLTIWVLFPFYWAIIVSLKQPIDEFRLSFIPFLQFTPTLDHWQSDLFSGSAPILQAALNSVVIATGSMAIALGLGTLAGYGLARFRYRRLGNRNLAMWFLSQQFLPPIVTVIPYFLVMQPLHLLDTKTSLIIADSTFIMPFAVLVTRDAFRSLAGELVEAALVDGCHEFSAFYRVMLPLVLPAIASAGIICFSFSWNEFLYALILTYQKAVPISVFIAGSTTSSQGIEFWYIGTRTLIAITIPVILSLVAQRYIVRGLSLGAVKG
jgi:multiple sugar transport system permease protein